MDFVYYSKNKVDDLSKFARNLSLYLRYVFSCVFLIFHRSRGLSIPVFLSEIQNPLLFEKEKRDLKNGLLSAKVTPQRFYEFIEKTFLQSFKDTKLIQKYCYIMDIDQDGYIDEFDFSVFLRRHTYLDPSKTYDNINYRPSSGGSTITR